MAAHVLSFPPGNENLPAICSCGLVAVDGQCPAWKERIDSLIGPVNQADGQDDENDFVAPISVEQIFKSAAEPGENPGQYADRMLTRRAEMKKLAEKIAASPWQGQEPVPIFKAQPAIEELREGDKQSNPKQAAGDKKLPMQLVPQSAVAAESLVYFLGMLKYGRMNWREAGVQASTYVGAALRHLTAWVEGEEIDPETGVTHLASVRACMGIVIDAQVHGKLIDDRNYTPAGKDAATVRYMAELQEQIEAIRAKFGDRTPKHFDRRLHEGRDS